MLEKISSGADQKQCDANPRFIEDAFDRSVSRWWKEHITYYETSSTARGDGGSFKNRKPIGEIGCCESRTKQNTD